MFLLDKPSGCKKNDCQYFCIPTPQGKSAFKCLCPDQMKPLVNRPNICARKLFLILKYGIPVKFNCRSASII